MAPLLAPAASGFRYPIPRIEQFWHSGESDLARVAQYIALVEAARARSIKRFVCYSMSTTRLL